MSKHFYPFSSFLLFFLSLFPLWWYVFPVFKRKVVNRRKYYQFHSSASILIGNILLYCGIALSSFPPFSLSPFWYVFHVFNEQKTKKQEEERKNRFFTVDVMARWLPFQKNCNIKNLWTSALTLNPRADGSNGIWGIIHGPYIAFFPFLFIQ